MEFVGIPRDLGTELLLELGDWGPPGQGVGGHVLPVGPQINLGKLERPFLLT